MVGIKCVLMKKQCILEAFEQFHYQFFNLKQKQNPKTCTGPIINPKLFVDKHLATYIPVISHHLFLMLNKYTVIMDFFFTHATGITGTECSHSAMTCKQMVWVQQEKVGWRSCSDSVLRHCWGLVPGLYVLEEIWGLSKGIHQFFLVCPFLLRHPDSGTIIYYCALCYNILVCCFF